MQPWTPSMTFAIYLYMSMTFAIYLYMLHTTHGEVHSAEISTWFYYEGYIYSSIETVLPVQLDVGLSNLPLIIYVNYGYLYRQLVVVFVIHNLHNLINNLDILQMSNWVHGYYATFGHQGVLYATLSIPTMPPKCFVM